MTQLRALSRIDIVSADPLHLASFYQGLGFHHSATLRVRGETRLELQLGDERIGLIGPAKRGAPYPPSLPGWDVRFQHFAIVVSDMRPAYAILQAQGRWTAISTDGPVRLPDGSGGVIAFKFRDPEGHPVELIAFPGARPPEHWRRTKSADPFLGIDHSAISVADTARSTRFYGELGLARTGGSLNLGAEQARLDGLAAPVVEVTGLSPQTPTPHLELLCYRDRPVRDVSRPDPCDITATRLVFGETASTMVHDPDGHLIVTEDEAAYSGST